MDIQKLQLDFDKEHQTKTIKLKKGQSLIVFSAELVDGKLFAFFPSITLSIKDKDEKFVKQSFSLAANVKDNQPNQTFAEINGKLDNTFGLDIELDITIASHNKEMTFDIVLIYKIE